MQKYYHNTQVATKQPSAIITQRQDILNVAESYIASGFVLVPIPYGKKAPALKGWNKRTNTISSLDQIEHLIGQNIGLAHAYSGTCAIDIDDFNRAVDIFNDNGIDLTNLLMTEDAVQIKSGRENRAKLLYRTTEILPWFQHCEEGQTIFEFRRGTANGLTVQDVLPPSIHPDTGKPYTWQGDWKNLPMLPVEMYDFWLQKNFSVDPSKLPKDKKTHRRNITSVGVPITSVGVSSDYQPLDNIESSEQVRTLFSNEAIQRRLLDYLRFTEYEALFKHKRVSVRSVVPPYDFNKSGGLILADSGDILFHDFSGACGKQHVPLQVLHARLKAGFYVRLTPTEKDEKAYGKVTLVVWAVRLLVDAGIVKPAIVLLPPCPELRNSVKQFYAGVESLFQVRWAFKDHYGFPITMGRKFMSAWCGLSEDQCRAAIKDLLKAGVIHTAGQHGRALLFAPGYEPPQQQEKSK